MKVFVPKPGEDWICDVLIDEFRAFCEKRDDIDIVDDINECDVVWLLAKWIWNRFPHEILKQKRVITTVHHIVPEKGFDVGPFEAFTDVYHVPNRHTESMLRSSTQKPISCISYWSNPDKWFVDDDLKFTNGLMNEDRFKNARNVLASFQRDTEGSSIRTGRPTPKLEKGPDIFAGIVTSFDKDDVFPWYPGWRRDYLKVVLRDYVGFGSDDKMQHIVLPELYNLIRMCDGHYLVTSRYEGGPQAIIEAALTKTKILSTDVGMASEVLHPDCIVCAPDDPDIVRKFHDAIEKDVCRQEQLDFNLHRALELAPDKHIPKFVEMLEGLR